MFVSPVTGAIEAAFTHTNEKDYGKHWSPSLFHDTRAHQTPASPSQGRCLHTTPAYT